MPEYPQVLWYATYLCQSRVVLEVFFEDGNPAHSGAPTACAVAIVLFGASSVGARIELRGKFARGNDLRGLVAAERGEFFVAGHKKFGLASLGERKQIAIFRVRGHGAGGQILAKNR